MPLPTHNPIDTPPPEHPTPHTPDTPTTASHQQALHTLMVCMRDLRNKGPALDAAWGALQATVALLQKHGIQVRSFGMVVGCQSVCWTWCLLDMVYVV